MAKVYAICDNNCKYETMDKEQILAAIAQAVNEGTIGECDTGFITTIKTINGHPLKFFAGTQSEYDALNDEDKANLFALITNDGTRDGLLNAVANLQIDLGEVLDGKRAVPWAEKANGATLIKCGAPVKATRLTESGYYYIQNELFDGEMFGATLYWQSGVSTSVILYALLSTAVERAYTMTLCVKADGELKLYMREASRADELGQDWGGTFYVKKIGE